MWIFAYFVALSLSATISGSRVRDHKVFPENIKTLSNDNVTHSVSETKSLSDYARVKLANLQDLRSQLIKHQQQMKMQQEQSNNKTELLQAFDQPLAQRVKNRIRESNTTKGATAVEPKEAKSSLTPDDARNNFWSSMIPNTDILQKLARMRKKLEPNLRSYLTTKYNDFLTNLVEYSDNIGVPPYVLNSMKIPQNFDPRWSVIEKLLETSSLEKFLSQLPELAAFTNLKTSPLLANRNSDDVVRGRNDDDFISDQEPQATSKGKKKYGGLRLANRVKVYRKGDEYGPQRTGYEYGTPGDQYGLYSHSSYDTSYGKGYDDYYSTKATGGSDKSYGDYSGKTNGMKGLIGKYAGLGFSSGAYADNYGAAGHNSYSYGSGHGHGGGGGGGGSSGLNNYMDPFSILGGLAFLVYLGLLFQQSLNRTGRSMPSSIFDTPWRKPVVLTQLSFDEDFQEEPTRHTRSVNNLEDTAVESLESFWHNVEVLKKIENPRCRQQETCQVMKDLYNSGFLSLFQQEVEVHETDKAFIDSILKQLENDGSHFECDSDLHCDLENQEILFNNRIIGND